MKRNYEAISENLFFDRGKPNQDGGDIGAGNCRLYLVLSAAETAGKRLALQITYDGHWHFDEAKMFEAVEISLLS